MKVLFDTNVVLDLLLERAPFVDAAEQLVSLVDSGRIDGVICSTTATTIHYLASRAVGPTTAVDYLRRLLTIFDVASVDREVLLGALDLGFADFEDAVLHEAALGAGAVAIVTRDASGFARSTIPVFDPVELLAVAGVDST